jgi:hypothetical protein
VLRVFVIAVAIGALSEVMARLARLWLYRRPIYPVLNVLVVFGAVMGGVAMLAPSLGLAGVFGLGFALGLAYEAANLAVLDWWIFPDDRLLFLRGKTACAVGVSVSWGLVPVAVAMCGGVA